MDNTQAQAVADIALSIPEKPTSADVLKALNRAYRAGVQHGVMTHTAHHNAVMGVIGKLLEPRA